MFTSTSPASPKPMGFFRRYWRGDYPLVVSFWGVTLGFNIFAFAFLQQIGTLEMVKAPQLIAAILLTIWIILTLGTVWLMVGLWRAASRYYLRNAQRWYWTVLAKGVVILLSASFGNTLLSQGWSQSQGLVEIILRTNPNDHYAIHMLPGGQMLEIYGGMGFGVTDDVRQALAANPNVSVIVLNSFGGRVAEARVLAQLIEARGLDTATSYDCSSACILPFVAGVRRLQGPEATLGFHQYAFPGVSGLIFAQQHEADQAYLLRRGIAADFVARIFATPATELWQPSQTELRESRFVTDTLVLQGIDASAPHQ